MGSHDAIENIEIAHLYTGGDQHVAVFDVTGGRLRTSATPSVASLNFLENESSM
jgi:hypothetical protein